MKTICISGVSRGLGLGLAEHFLEKGHRVFGSIRRSNIPEIHRLEERYPDRFVSFKMDVTRRKSIEQAALAVTSHTDAIDILINNAGIFPKEDSLEIQAISDRSMLEAFNVNVLGPLLCTQAFLPLLRRSRSPKIVMIS